MSQPIQLLLASVKRPVSDPLWDGKPNSWIRQLGARDSAHTAQLMVSLAVQGSVVDDPTAGYKVAAGDSRIEVRLATLGLMSGGRSLMW